MDLFALCRDVVRQRAGTAPMTTAAFLDRLFAGCDDGLVEVRATPSGQRAWTTLGDWTALGSFVSYAVRSRQNVYVGLATRKDTTSGTAENLRALSMLYADIDQPPTVVRTLLDSFPFRPALLVHSGLNTHVYLELREALPVATPHDIHRAASLLRRLAAFVNGDDRATSPAQAPRLVNTVNWKYGDARPVTVVDQTTATVDAAELEDFLPTEIVNRRTNQMTIASTIPTGARNDTLYALTRSLRCKDIPFAVISEAVRVVNEKLCEPPLPDHELDRMLHYALLQPNRVGFVPPTPVPTLVHRPPPRQCEQEWSLTPSGPRAPALVAALLAETPSGVLAGSAVLARAHALAIPERSIRRALRQAGLVAHSSGKGAARRTVWIDRTRGRR